MKYIAIITKEGSSTLAEFPDCPGCQTFTDPGEDIAAAAAEALEGWIEASLVGGDVVSLPSEKVSVPKGARALAVAVPPSLAIAVQLRALRAASNLTQKELAHRAHMKQQQIARLEKPGGNPTIETLGAVAAALGVAFEVALVGPRSLQNDRLTEYAHAAVKGAFVARLSEPARALYAKQKKSGGVDVHIGGAGGFTIVDKKGKKVGFTIVDEKGKKVGAGEVAKKRPRQIAS